MAVGVEQLANTGRQLLAAGCQRLLLERPGALTLSCLEDLQAVAHAVELRCLLPTTVVFTPTWSI